MLAIAQMIIPMEDPPLVLPLSKLKPIPEALFSVKAHLHENLQRMSDDAYVEHVSRAVDSFEQQTKNHFAVRSTLAELHRISSCFLDRGAETSSSSMTPSWQSTKVLSRVSDYSPISTQPMPPDSERSPTSFFEATSSQRLASPSAWFRDQRYVRILRWVHIQRRARTNRRLKLS